MICSFRVEPPTKKKKIELRRKSSEIVIKKFDTPEVRNGQYPDASKWKVEEVVKFFLSLGFTEQAQSLKDQVTFTFCLVFGESPTSSCFLNLNSALKLYHLVKAVRGLDS